MKRYRLSKRTERKIVQQLKRLTLRRVEERADLLENRVLVLQTLAHSLTLGLDALTQGKKPRPNPTVEFLPPSYSWLAHEVMLALEAQVEQQAKPFLGTYEYQSAQHSYHEQLATALSLSLTRVYTKLFLWTTLGLGVALLGSRAIYKVIKKRRQSRKSKEKGET